MPTDEDLSVHGRWIRHRLPLLVVAVVALAFLVWRAAAPKDKFIARGTISVGSVGRASFKVSFPRPGSYAIGVLTPRKTAEVFNRTSNDLSFRAQIFFEGEGFVIETAPITEIGSALLHREGDAILLADIHVPADAPLRERLTVHFEAQPDDSLAMLEIAGMELFLIRVGSGRYPKNITAHWERVPISKDSMP